MKQKSLFLLLVIYLSVAFNVQSQNIWGDTGTNIDFSVLETLEDYTIQDILEKDALFQPSNKISKKTNPSETYWIKLDFKDPFPKEINEGVWYLRFVRFDYATIYTSDQKDISGMKIGRLQQNISKSLIGKTSEASFQNNVLINNRYLYLKVKQVTVFEPIEDWNFNYISQHNYSKTNALKHLSPLYFFGGICLIIFILTIAFLGYFKEIQYFYYASYILLIYLFLAGEPLGFNNYLFGNNALKSIWFSQTIKISFNIVYILFCAQFGNAKYDYKPIYKVLISVVYIELCLIVLNTFLLYNNAFLLNIYLMHFHHLIMVICVGTSSLIYVLIYGKNKLTFFIAAGATVYSAAFLVQYYLNIDSAIDQTFRHNNYYLLIGFTLEIIIFSIGLSYKILMDYNEKLRFERESFQNKTIALRAQINPHFIFNSLSSIQHLITSNDRASALKYLSKFSRFTRNVLESSIETDILLTEEIAMLKDYLELESLRFKNEFTYSINVSEAIDPGAIEIPLLVIQPFVENAIIHGFLNKKSDDNILKINFYKQEDFLICEIDDNGIGRQNSKSITSIRKKKSRGLQVTKERLNMFNRLNNETNTISIIDKKNDEGDALGTKVIIKILIR